MHCSHYFYISGSGSMGFPCPEVGNLMWSLVLGLMRSMRPALSWSLLNLLGWALVILLLLSRGWVPSGKMTLPTAYSVSVWIDTCSLFLRSLHCVFFCSFRMIYFFSPTSSGHDNLLRLQKSQIFPYGLRVLSLSGYPTQFWLWQ